VRNDRDLALRRAVSIPPGRLAPIVGQWPGCAILESAPGFGNAGRWSVYAARPRGVFEAMNTSWRIRYEAGTAEAGVGDPLGRLARLLDELGLSTTDDDGDDLPFRGGLIGYYGYDLAPRIEHLPRRSARESRMPDVRFALYDAAIVVDHATGTAEFVASDMLGEGRRALERRWEEWDRAIGEASLPAGTAWLKPPRPGLTRDAYLAAVRRALEYIRAGDIFQVNLSQRFSCDGVVGPTSQPDPLTIYLRLRMRSPAPFAALLRWKDLAIVSASPELFYQTRGRSIVTRPIKGTRPRGLDPAEDERLLGELRRSPKDRAELTMIVDLERNDLGRVCEYGSVRVVEPGAIESFAQVHHLVATVDGRLRPGTGPIDIVRAVFPGGSITGAPKIRAMEIIDELEPTRRGVYTGAIGYYGLGGRSAFNIAIRTLLIEGDRVHYQVGGGIVADSDPQAEYEETLHKGQGLRQALEGPCER
jgi:para-aminobenzoate synthetase component 1